MEVSKLCEILMTKIPKISVSLSKKLLGATLILSFLTSACGGKPQASREAIPVTLQTLETATLIDSTQYVGTLEAKKRVNLAPRIQGRILEIFVQQGDKVPRGKQIVKLEPTREQEEVKARIADVNVAKAELSEAEAQLRTREAERARAAANVEEARADLQDAEAEVILAEVNYKRSKFLVGEGVRPDQDLDDKTRDLKTDIAQRDAQKEALNAQLKALTAAERQVDEALALVNRRKEGVARARGQLGSTSQDLAYNTVVAPIGGVVGDFNEYKIGDVVNIGDQLTTITDNKLFDLRINIPTEFRSRLKLGLPVEIVNGDGSRGAKGQITYIAPLVDQNTQSIVTKVTFRNDGTLRDRQYVRVRVIWEEKPGLLITTTAVTTLGGQKFVFVAEPGESKQEEEATLVARQKPIKTLSIQGQAYQVISGVKPGDRVIVSRILDLRNGTPIKEESVKTEKPIEQ